MRLNLLNIDDFIKRNQLKQVTSNQIFSDTKSGKLDNNGLWSEIIFGLKGSKERNTKFGYIELGTRVIHPEVYNILVNINADLKKLINETQKYSIKNGQLVLDEKGNTGINYFIENFDKIDLMAIAKKDKTEDAKFILDHKDQIFISRWLVLPAGIRDIIIEPNYTRIMYSEINDLYKELIQNSLILQSMIADEIKNKVVLQIQKTLIKINKWIKDKMKGKYGLFRGLLLKKTNDFSARVVITIDPNIELGKIAIPWNILFVCYEPFCFHYIMKKDEVLKNEICTFLKLDDCKKLDLDKLKEFSMIVNKEFDTIPTNLKSMIINMLEEIVKDKHILFKRDPVATRYNWRSAEIIITDGTSAVLNPLDLGPLGGDIDGDQIALFALHTKESNDEAKMLNPKYNKKIFQGPRSINDITYNFSKDIIATIFAATA